MKPNLPTMALAGMVLLLLTLCLWPVLGQPWIFSRCIDLDINSGDLRRQVRVFSLTVSTQIEESDVSREVRRLGIEVPAERVWKTAFQSHLVQSRHVNCRYGGVFVLCAQVLLFLDEAHAPDEERRAVMERLMAHLRTGDPRLVREVNYLLLAEIAERHDLQGFTRQFEARIQELRAARSRTNQP
jgi:hypothetical protein